MLKLMMLALLGKELRYRALNLLTLPTIAIAAAWGLHALAGFQREGREYEGILTGAFTGASTILCATVGLAFGLRQTLGEIRPGAWAFLRHRPASAGEIFFAKLLAALILYLVVLLPPVLGVIWYAAMPGHFPGPWTSQMAIPFLIDILCGTLYIPAGILCAVRDARWFGSRLLPIGLAVFCSVFTWFPLVWVAALAPFVGWFILLPVAYSAFANRGRESRQRLFPRALTAVTLLPATIAIPAFAGSMLLELCSQRPGYAYYDYSWYLVSGDQAYRGSYTQNRQGAQYQPLVSQNSVPATAPSLNELPRGGYGASSLLTSTEWMSAHWRHYRQASAYVMPFQWGARTNAGERWYYIPDAGYLVGYYSHEDETPRNLGYINARGWSARPPTAGRFHSTPATMQRSMAPAIIEDGGVIAVDLLSRTVRNVFFSPAGEKCLSAARVGRNNDDWTHGDQLWSITTDAAAYLLRESPGIAQPELLLRRPHLGTRYPQVMIGATGDFSRFAFLYSPRWDDRQTPNLFLRLNRDNSELVNTTLPQLPQPASWARPKWMDSVEACCIPPIAVLADACWNHGPTRYHVWTIASAVLGAAIAIWLLRRYSERRGWIVFWATICAILGVGGVLLLLAVRDWPPRIVCPACQRRTVASRFACQWCHQPYPRPNPGDIAIFDAVPAALPA